ncbi:MAG: hypothetical protein HOP08_01570 [Cyclobacteriaceae bacterium]|nr:hypothetical protein [Cyclobacteriaceae bacterium]
MERQRRQFYIIGHNPNTGEQAKDFLEKGANALAPDIVYDQGKFYVTHSTQSSYKDIPTVEVYLQALRELLATQQYNLALLIWDIKVTNFDINLLINTVKTTFSGHENIAMVFTHANDCGFVCRYNGSYDNVGIGVDESNITPDELAKIFISNRQNNFIYGDGIITLLNKPQIFKNAREALHQRDANKEGGFKIVYPWVLARPVAMQKYLNSYVDGIIVDLEAVDHLKSIIYQSPYTHAFQLAQSGHNPFLVSTIPIYLLNIKTKDEPFAGTDAWLSFTLKGTSGKLLHRLPFHANAKDIFERGSTTYLTLEGLDIGEIESLTVEALSDGLGSGWLPENISVECKTSGRIYDFDFKDDDEWITKKGGPVMKLAKPRDLS